MRIRPTILSICLAITLLPSAAMCADVLAIHPDLKKSLEVANSHKKILLVDFWGAWCPWCKKMDKVVASPSIKATVNKSFHYVKLDVGRGNKHASCVATYQVSYLPHFVVFNKDGTIRDQFSGYRSAKNFKLFLKRNLTPRAFVKSLIHPDLQAELQKANGAGKVLLVDFYADWCGWCKRLDLVVADPSVKAILDKQFRYVKLDVGRFDKHVGCLEMYNVTGIPLMLAFNRDGSVNAVCNGYKDVEGFKEFLQEAAGVRS